MSEENKYQFYENEAFNYFEGDNYVRLPKDDFGNALKDIDFSNLEGDFKKSFSEVNRRLKTKVIAPENRKVIVEGVDRDLDLPTSGQKVFAPENRKVIVEGLQDKKRPVQREFRRPPLKQKPQEAPINQRIEQVGLKGGENYQFRSERPQKISKVIAPQNRKVIVEGVNDFILNDKGQYSQAKNIGYYKGKKLKELVLTFNNDSAVPFELELFNPSMPLDYLYSTSLNLNDKIQVAGGEVSYTDVLFNILANSTMIPNAKFVFSGSSLTQQKVEPITIINKAIEGVQKVYPFNLDLQVDTMQVQNDIIFFDFWETINRPYIPDGMDVMKYKVLPNMTVTMALYYDQISLKKVFRKESRNDKGVL